MEYPTLNVKQKSRQMSDAFLGYNHNLRIGENEFYDMKNLTSDFYPVLSPRKQRGVYGSPTSPSGLIAKDALCYVDGSKFVINEYAIDMGLSDGPKQLVSMGANVIILPDKKYINTSNHEHGNIDAWKTTSGEVTFTLCKMDGTAYGTAEELKDIAKPNEPYTDLKPEEKDKKLWIDTSTTPHTLKQYSATNAVWVAIATTYVMITCPGLNKDSDGNKIFKQYDGVTISGITSEALKDLNSATTIWSCDEDSIVVTGILDAVTTQSTPICISRWMPKVDFLIESSNRLWGCFYGFPYKGKAYNTEKGITEDVYGQEAVNEIYACKLGDYTNWNCFMGLSTDSYAVSVGTDGQFTGAITHLGYPCFFKENVLHKIYGDYPSNYRVQDTACRGVQKGCERSLAIVNEVLFYKSRSGVCAYDGSLPEEVSYQFGNELYSQAVGGSHGNKYYISMMDAKNQYHLFVYDTSKGMWHKEDDLRAECFCSNDEEMYAIADGKIITLFGSGTKDTKPVEWMAQTGEIGLSSPDMKYISRMNVRMSLAPGSTVDFFIQYELSDEWERIWNTTGTSLRSFSVPIRPKRCDHMKLKIVGKGDAKIYSITKTIEQGSELS
jgi:hypothetical protein